MKKSKEWEMVQELIEYMDELTENQGLFIQGLFDYLDPYFPFLEQQTEGQLTYLHQLHDLYVNGNEEAFEDEE